MRWLLILLIVLGGCGSEGGPGPDVDGGGGVDAYDAGMDEEIPECVAQTDCGKAEEMLCIAGECESQPEGFGELMLSVGFPRGSEWCADHIMVYVYYETCEDEGINLMTFPHRFNLVWTAGGTFFFDLWIQKIRPGNLSIRVEAVDEEEVIGSGCNQIDVVRDASNDVIVSVTLF